MSARDDLREGLEEPIQRARDHAHWLAVHRGHLSHNDLAKHLEALLDAALRMARDLGGQVSRAEARSARISAVADEYALPCTALGPGIHYFVSSRAYANLLAEVEGHRDREALRGN